MVLSATCLSLAACGGGGGGGDPADAATPPGPDGGSVAARTGGVPVGVVTLVERANGRTSLDAWFDRRAEADVERLAGAWASEPSGAPWRSGDDVCRFEADVDPRAEAAAAPAGSASLSAGERLSLTGRAGTWATLEPQRLDDVLVYASELRTLVGPMPDDLVLEVPGGEFPAFGDVRLPAPEPLEAVEPVDGTFGPDASAPLRWQAGSMPGATIGLTLRTGTGAWHCSLVDDGAFDPPPEPMTRLVPSHVERIAREYRDVRAAPGPDGDRATLVVEWLSER